jgi:hypothetical protein
VFPVFRLLDGGDKAPELLVFRLHGGDGLRPHFQQKLHGGLVVAIQRLRHLLRQIRNFIQLGPDMPTKDLCAIQNKAVHRYHL